MSKVDDIDSLIGRNKEALRKIEESKRILTQSQSATFTLWDRFSRHWQTHGNTWTTVVFSGSILVLSLRILNLRKELAEVQETLGKENSYLQKENERLKLNMKEVETTWDTILAELKGTKWTSGKIIEKIEMLTSDTRKKTMDTEQVPTEEKEKPKRKGFLV